MKKCPTCDGRRTCHCDECHGSGKVGDPDNQNPHYRGETCPKCRGAGRNDCQKCGGRGFIEEMSARSA